MSTRKEIAVAFLRLAASGRAREGFEKYGGPGFRHHNPHFNASPEALMDAMDENARQNPQKQLAVQHAVEEGDVVAVHSCVQHNAQDRGVAVVHIFRFANDRIVELWDVAQPVPDRSPNTNGMF